MTPYILYFTVRIGTRKPCQEQHKGKHVPHLFMGFTLEHFTLENFICGLLGGSIQGLA